MSAPLFFVSPFAAALEHFKQRELDAAEALFQKVFEQRGAADGPSEFYLKQIARCRAHPESGDSWDGVIRFESK